MKNEYIVTKKLMLSWAREYHLRGAANVILFALWCLVGVLGVALLGMLLVKGGPWTQWYLSILFVVLTVYKLVFSRFVVLANRYKVLSRTYGVAEWIRSVEFGEDAMHLTDHNSQTTLQYANLQAIREKGNVVLLLMNHNMGVRLYKDAFVQGSWEECRAFLAGKIGR